MVSAMAPTMRHKSGGAHHLVLPSVSSSVPVLNNVVGVYACAPSLYVRQYSVHMCGEYVWK